MSLLTNITNKIQYQVSKATNDPEAEAYAQVQAKQAAQDAATAARVKADQEAAAAAQVEADKKSAEAASLADRSKFNIGTLIRDIANYIIMSLMILIVIGLIFYGGSISANQNIGYSVLGRIISFMYGSLLSPFMIIWALYKMYWKNEVLPYAAFLPISTYMPNGILQQLFIGPFCYQENEQTRAERAKVIKSYSDKSAELRHSVPFSTLASNSVSISNTGSDKSAELRHSVPVPLGHQQSQKQLAE